MTKRIFDFIVSLIALAILLPFFVIIAVFILFDSRGGIFYLQTRIGKNEKPFKIFKFRTMRIGADKKGLLTIGMKDSRITRVGIFLRKYKIDELPQLLNVLIGNMSLVGPRPETPNFVALYSDEQRKVFTVKPGITDEASIEYVNENEILSKYTDAEKAYVEIVMPAKLAINLKYVQHHSFGGDLKIIWKTIRKIFSS